MLSVYLVKVKVYNAIRVPVDRLKYTILSVYLVKVKVYNAISLPGEG